MPYDASGLWAKTGEEDGWLSLEQHLADSADVAERLWDRWVASSVKARLAAWCGGAAAARSLAIFLAGAHDCGKATPAFQSKGTPPLQEQTRKAGFELDPFIARRASSLPHGTAGHHAMRLWLGERHGWSHDEVDAIACVVGGHHGVFPATSDRPLARPREFHDLMGSGPWEAARFDLLDRMAARADVATHVASWRASPVPAPAQALLAGLVIMSDWIASNTELFALGEPIEGRADLAWDALGLPEPWLASLPTDTDTALRARFDLPDNASARPVQTAALNLVDQLDEPGLVIIEAAMGTGKTEAALLVAERLAERFELNGLYFALPSMATSDAIFSRVHQWVEHLDVPHGFRAPMFLAHSRAQLNDEYRGIAQDGQVLGICDDDSQHAVAVVHEWFSGRKRGLLATFAVGTIDQVLMMALQSKHLVLRHLGLAGKVVVIDEVHATDVYMSEFLARALEWLGVYRVPVVLLSATLPPTKRGELLEAYRRGRHGRDFPAVDVDEATSGDYPLITASTTTSVVSRAADPGPASTLTIRSLRDDDAALDSLLQDRLADGGCAVIVRNTVGRAQATYTHLRRTYGEDVTLVHSRFIATHRQEREAALLDRFGSPWRATARPRRHVVVATQVIEQSLDLDFDLMITDVAPADLALQRSGRLHRHARERPDRLADAELWVTGVSWDAAGLPTVDRGAAAVYGEASLLRALVSLDLPGRRTLRLPRDIPAIVRRAYSDDPGFPTSWAELVGAAEAKARSRAEARRNNAAPFRIDDPSVPTLMGWTERSRRMRDDPAEESRGRSAVRDGHDSIEVVVVRQVSDELVARWDPRDSDELVPTQFVPDDAVARRLSADTVLLPPTLTFPGRDIDTIEALERTYYPGWQGSRWLKGRLVLPIGTDGSCALGDFVLTYDDHLGLSVVTGGGMT